MKKPAYNSLIAFFGGLFGISILYLIFDAAHFKNLFLEAFLDNSLYFFILISFVEESTKFLLIKRNIGQFPYGFLLGFGFGAGETILRHPFSEFGPVPQRRIGAILLHVITAGIICYAIKKNKPILGFLTAIIIHTGFNLIIDWAVR